MPHRMQGRHVVRRQMTSNLLEVSGDCILLLPRLPSLCELAAAVIENLLLGHLEIAQLVLLF